MIVQTWKKLIGLICVGMLASACGQLNVDMDDLDGILPGPGIIDFSKSLITIQQDNVPADGIASAIVLVILRNKDNLPVPSYTPTYNITGSGVIPHSCTPSDANGVSICVVKSTVAGQKGFAVSNIGIPLSETIRFRAPALQSPLFLAGPSNTLRAMGRDSIDPSQVNMVALATFGEVMNVNPIDPLDDTNRLNDGTSLIDPNGFPTMTNPNPPFQTVVRPVARINRHGVIHAD